jgi:hypothetical protein
MEVDDDDYDYDDDDDDDDDVIVNNKLERMWMESNIAWLQSLVWEWNSGCLR